MIISSRTVLYLVKYWSTWAWEIFYLSLLYYLRMWMMRWRIRSTLYWSSSWGISIFLKPTRHLIFFSERISSVSWRECSIPLQRTIYRSYNHLLSTQMEAHTRLIRNTSSKTYGVQHTPATLPALTQVLIYNPPLLIKSHLSLLLKTSLKTLLMIKTPILSESPMMSISRRESRNHSKYLKNSKSMREHGDIMRSYKHSWYLPMRES